MKNLTPNRYASIPSLLSRVGRFCDLNGKGKGFAGTSLRQNVVGGIRSLDEQLSLLHDTISLIAVMVRGRRGVAPEQILRELASSVTIPKDFRFVEALAELTHDSVRSIDNILKLGSDQC